MKWLAAAVCAVACLANGGCFERAYCGMAWEAEVSWSQAEVFTNFPQDTTNPRGYSVWWTHEREYVPPGGPVKGQPPPTPPPEFDPGNVTGKYAMGETGAWRTRLVAAPDGNVSWQVSAYEAEGDAWTRDRLQRTFADLGLPPPVAADEAFHWQHAC